MENILSVEDLYPLMSRTDHFGGGEMPCFLKVSLLPVGMQVETKAVQMELCTGTQGRDILHDAARVCSLVDGSIISQIVQGIQIACELWDYSHGTFKANNG